MGTKISQLYRNQNIEDPKIILHCVEKPIEVLNFFVERNILIGGYLDITQTSYRGNGIIISERDAPADTPGMEVTASVQKLKKSIHNYQQGTLSDEDLAFVVQQRPGALYEWHTGPADVGGEFRSFFDVQNQDLWHQSAIQAFTELYETIRTEKFTKETIDSLLGR